MEISLKNPLFCLNNREFSMKISCQVLQAMATPSASTRTTDRCPRTAPSKRNGPHEKLTTSPKVPWKLSSPWVYWLRIGMLVDDWFIKLTTENPSIERFEKSLTQLSQQALKKFPHGSSLTMSLQTLPSPRHFLAPKNHISITTTTVRLCLVNFFVAKP